MKAWEKEIYYQADLFISKSIDSNQDWLNSAEITCLDNISSILRLKYPDKTDQELITVLKQVIKMRLPHPAVILCFPGFKDRLDFMLHNYRPVKKIKSIPGKNKPRQDEVKYSFALMVMETSIIILYPKSEIIKNVDYGFIIANFVLPAEKLAFIFSNNLGSTFNYWLKYYNHQTGINFFVLNEFQAKNHWEIKRQIIRYQKR